MRVHQTENFRTTWRSDEQFVRIVVAPGAVVGLEEAVAHTAGFMSIVQGQTVPVLLDLSAVRSISRPARRHLQVPVREVKAVAAIVGTPVSRMVGNVFMGLSRMPHPMRLFGAESRAVKWLRQYEFRTVGSSHHSL